MATTIGKGVTLRGIDHESFSIPFNLTAGMVVADIGKPVTLSGAAANTVKLCGDTDVPIGQLRSVEDRAIEGVLVGTVSVMGFFEFKVDAGVTLDIGVSVTGSAVANELIEAVSANSTTIVVESSVALATVWIK